MTGRELLPGPKVPSAAPADAVYLDDLAEKSWYGYGVLGKHGMNKNGPYEWKGSQPRHALFIHPTSEKRLAAVEYDLAGRFESFSARVALFAKPDRKITFRVAGDGKTLWESVPMDTRGVETKIVVRVRGIRTLRLEVSGSFSYCGTVWLDARLTPARP